MQTPRIRARALALMNNATVGGQAVMEGVMMRSPGHWGVAIRRHNGEIVEVHREHRAFAARHAWAKLPLVRGVVALGESLGIGFRALSVSAHYAAEWIEAEGEDPAGEDHLPSATVAEVIPLPVPMPHSRPATGEDQVDGGEGAVDPSTGAIMLAETEESGNDANPDTIKTWQIALAFVAAFGFSIALFKLLPVFLTSFAGVGKHSLGFVLIESCIRIGIFILYLALVGLMPDMKRVFQYHSAEHKAINCWESGQELTPANVNAHSRIHVRCGTAFMLWVFVVAIAVFGAFQLVFPHASWLLIVASRVVLLPAIAGISFELIRFAGQHPNNRIIRTVMAPGLWMQYLTTRECNEEQCEVAIASLRLVLDRERADRDADNAVPDEDGSVAAQLLG